MFTISWAEIIVEDQVNRMLRVALASDLFVPLCVDIQLYTHKA